LSCDATYEADALQVDEDQENMQGLFIYSIFI
jgi:hypothetical protein